MAGALNINRKFDTSKFRHFINDWNAVLHCHHYSALYTQLADDAGEMFDGPAILKASVENSFLKVLINYFEVNQVTSIEDKVAIIEQYWAFAGMGNLKLAETSVDNGKAEMPISHMDAAWQKKWGNREKSVNFITCGYLSAAFSALHNFPEGTFEANETQSIVAGADKSLFTITKK